MKAYISVFLKHTQPESGSSGENPKALLNKFFKIQIDIVSTTMTDIS